MKETPKDVAISGSSVVYVPGFPVFRKLFTNRENVSGNIESCRTPSELRAMEYSFQNLFSIDWQGDTNFPRFQKKVVAQAAASICHG